MKSTPTKPKTKTVPFYTPEGRARIAAAQRKRWARYRKMKQAEEKALAAKARKGGRKAA